jgi:hypothetical protein
MACSCKFVHETLSSVKSLDFLDKMDSSQLLKKEHAQYHWLAGH